MYSHRRNDSFEKPPRRSSFYEPHPPVIQSVAGAPMSARPLPPPSSARSSIQASILRNNYRSSPQQTARESNIPSPAYSPNPKKKQARRDKYFSQKFFHTPFHPRAQSTLDENPYEFPKDPPGYSKSARDGRPTPPLPYTSSYRSQLSSSEMMTQLQFSLSTIEVSGYDRLEEISCSMHNLKDSVGQIKSLLERPPKRPEEQHIEIPVSVWNDLNLKALKSQQQADLFEKELQSLIKEAWDQKDKLITKKKQIEKVLSKVNEERKQNRRKILVQQTELDQRNRALENKQSELQTGFQQLGALWEEQTGRIKSNIGQFQDTMDYQLHDDWSFFLKSLKKNADTSSKEFYQQVYANHALTCSGKINFSELNEKVFITSGSKNANKGNNMIVVDQVQVRPDGIKEDEIKALSKKGQRHNLSYISDRVPYHSREPSANILGEGNADQNRAGGANESFYSQDSEQIFNGPAKGMELEPEWDPALDDASSNRCESPSRLSVIQKFKGECENSEMPAFLKQVLKIAKNKDDIVKVPSKPIEQNIETPPPPKEKVNSKPFLREMVGKKQQSGQNFISSGSKKIERVRDSSHLDQSQSQRISPMLSSKVLVRVERSSLSDSGQMDNSVAQVSGEQNPRDWIKQGTSDMMDLLKTATDQRLVRRLEDIKINDGVQIQKIVAEHQQGRDQIGSKNMHDVLEKSLDINLPEQNKGPRQPESNILKQRGGSISSQQQSIRYGGIAQDPSGARIQISSRQPSLEMSSQQVQSFQRQSAKHTPKVSATSSQISSESKSRLKQAAENRNSRNCHIQIDSLSSQIQSQTASQYSQGRKDDDITSQSEQAPSNYSPISPSLRAGEIPNQASEFIVKEKCINPKLSLEVIQENHSEFSNSQSVLDSVNRSEVGRRMIARRKAAEHHSLHGDGAKPEDNFKLVPIAKSEIPRNFKRRMLDKLDSSQEILETNRQEFTPKEKTQDKKISDDIDVQILIPGRREFPQLNRMKEHRSFQEFPSYKSLQKNRQSAPPQKQKKTERMKELGNIIATRLTPSQKTPSARKQFKRSSIKYRKINKDALADSFSKINQSSGSILFPQKTKSASGQNSLIIESQKLLSNRNIHKIGSPQNEIVSPKLNASVVVAERAKKLNSRNLLESLSGKDSLGQGKTGSNLFKNMLFSLVADPKGLPAASIAVAKRPYQDQGSFQNESRLFEALQLAQPQPSPYQGEESKSATSPNCYFSQELQPIYSSYVREGQIDLNLHRSGICFLSGEQNIQHFGEYSLFNEGFHCERRESDHSTEQSQKYSIMLKRPSQKTSAGQRQLGRIIRLNSGLFVTAAIDLNSLKTDTSRTGSRQFCFGVAPKVNSGILSQRVSQRRLPNSSLETGRNFETMRRDGRQEELGSKGITMKWH